MCEVKYIGNFITAFFL